MNNRRDWRVNPKAGDIVGRSRYHPRKVAKVDGLGVRLHRGNHLLIWSLSYFREWAVKAEIFNNADDDAPAVPGDVKGGELL